MSTQQLVLGTAGHIDHGKTSLVRALTGVDCDRLPEEKSRGITIDLGFAHFEADDVRFGIVDVPGHERFVHNMVAGSTGIDLALLVIACDDSVMPQTREHLAILDLLGISAGVIALTKRDLVDDEHLELVREEVAELTAGTCLESAPVVPVSSTTGQGLDELKDALVGVAHDFKSRHGAHFFRLPIDRVFTLQGHGTVVTGTVRSGRTQVGDTLVLLPEGRDVRVRRLQSHGSDADMISAGQRAAVNLAGVKQDEVHRGNELAAPGFLQPTRRLLAEIKVLEDEKTPLKHRRLVRLHLAAQEVTARIVMDESQVAPGDSAYAVLLCQFPVVSEYGQRFVLRRLSPVTTLGGGRVLSPVPGRCRTRRLLELALRLADPDPLERIDAWLEQQGEHELDARSLAVQVGVEPEQHDALLKQLVANRRILAAPGGGTGFLHPARRDRLKSMLVRRCEHEIERRRPARMVPAAPILTAAERWTSRGVADALLKEMVAKGSLIQRGERIGVAGESANLTQREQATLAALVDQCRGSSAPPSLKDFLAKNGLSLKQLEPIVQIAVDTGQLIRVSPELAADPDALDAVRSATVEFIESNGPATVAQLRDHWQVSRKYAVPYLELFDQLGITLRDGDTRTVGPHGHRSIEDLVE